MAETHELRLKINAAAARSGAREFVAAIRSIQTAVENLDNRSDAAFTHMLSKAKATGGSFKALVAEYSAARAANDRFAESIKRTNAALSRQMGLAAKTHIATAPTGATTGATRAGDQQLAMQNRVKRAVDDTRFAVEKLNTSLMHVGGFQAINTVSGAFQQFKKEVSGATVSAQQLDNAKTKLNTSLKAAQTSLVTLTAKAREEARAEKAAAAAGSERAHAAASLAKATAQEAAAQRNQNAAAEQAARTQLAAAAAMRQAEQEAAHLTNRLAAVGDTRGITAVSQSLNVLRSTLNNAGTSAIKVRQAMSMFSDATNKAKLSVMQTEGAQARAAQEAKKLAAAERLAANDARKVERELRSIAGAGNAVGKSMKNATGSMRGLENAFSSTFQVGSLFRTMLGSLTFGTFTKSVYEAGAALQQFRVTMEVATGSMSGALEQMDFISGMARELGTDLRTSREDFAKFAVAANLAGVETSTARDIFRSVSQAMTVMGRGAEDQRLAFLALEQMLSKNTISSEELRRQLGERLPGAVALMAKAVGVTTGELQDLLKQGKLVSSEVLPKFAREVDKAFGPGLDKALKRAPAALGRFRNEIEFFLSNISDTGLMDSLAKSFDRLTEAMRAPQARDAAEKLGRGLTDLAEIATGFAETFIEHIDTVGTVAKAVFGGVVIRQAILMANALVTGSSRSLAAFSTLTAAMTANTEAMAAHTEVLAVTTKAENSMTSAQARQTEMTDVQLATMLRANGVFAATPGIMARGATAMGAVGRAAGTAATGMATASRVFTGLAGPIGLAITALSLLPLLFSDSGDAAIKMADDVEAAVRRAGVSLDTLTARNVATPSLQAFQTLTDDLGTLETALLRVGRKQQTFLESMAAVQEVMKPTRGNYGGADAAVRFQQQRDLLESINTSRKALEGLSQEAKFMVSNVLDIGKAAASDKTSWVSLYEAINKTISLDPSTSAALEGLQKLAQKNAEAELAVAAHREQLTLLFGTSDDKAVTQFVQMALAALQAGEGLDKLQKSADDTMKTAPELGARYQEVLNTIRTEFAQGISMPQIHLDVSSLLGESAQQLETLQQTANDTAKAAVQMQSDFTESMGTVVSQLSGEGLDTTALEQAQELLANFSQFQDATLPLENLKIILGEMSFPTEQAQAFAKAVQEQFATLSPAEQTYDHFRQIVADLAKDSQFAGEGMDTFGQKLANAVRNTTEASLSAEDFKAALNSILEEAGFTTAQIEEMTQGLYNSATASNEAGRSAADAANGVLAAANAADQIGDAANGAANMVRALAGALASMGATGASFAAKGSEIVADLQFKARLKAMEAYRREGATFWHDAELGLREDMDAVIAAGGDATRAMEVYNREMSGLAAQRELIDAAALELANTTDPNTTSSRRGGGGGRSLELSNELKALKDINKEFQKRILNLTTEHNTLMALKSGLFETRDAAELFAQVQTTMGDATAESLKPLIKQIDLMNQLGKTMEDLANNPAKNFADSVGGWVQAGNKLEEGLIGNLRDGIHDLITGDFSFEKLGEAILGTFADIFADQATREILDMFNLTGQDSPTLGQAMGGTFGTEQTDPGITQLTGGGEQAGQSIYTSMITGGQEVAQMIQAAMTSAGQDAGASVQAAGVSAGTQMQAGVQTGGTIAGTQMNTQTMVGGTVAATQMSSQTQTGGTVAASQMQNAIISGGNVAASQMGQAAAAGGGGGGGLGGLFGGGGGMTGILLSAGLGLLSSIFSKKPEPSTAADQKPETPVGIRQYAEGTPNTSGIPAVLHPNEAVIPLSKGRKVPVEFGDGTGMNAANNNKALTQNFYIQTPDADSFRKSQKQMAADAASSGRKALSDNG